jgi:hypothetical protein
MFEIPLQSLACLLTKAETLSLIDPPNMDFLPELQGLIIKIAARHNPKFLTLNKSLLQLAMEGLYQVV